jgi:diaminopimelate decarboxylase
MKANRFLPILTHLRAEGIDGIDACSPAEVQLARQAGFREDQISFTGTSVSNADLDCLAAHPKVWINCDSLSTIRRLGERSPGRKIGLRINPRAGVGYRQNEQLQYSGEEPTKFGIYLDRIDDALREAANAGMEVTGIHFHAGCGYLDDQLPAFRRVIEEALPFLQKIPNLEGVNLGGGLGVPIVEGDPPLNLEAWCEVVGDTLGDVATSIWIEPGDFIVKDAGVLVLEVNTIEEKGGRTFVGVNGGFNLHIEPAFYHLPLEIVPCSRRAGESLSDVSIVGNINEALDVFAKGVDLPAVREGDFLAFLNAGGYGSSMSSNHCMRGQFAEYLVV